MVATVVIRKESHLTNALSFNPFVMSRLPLVPWPKSEEIDTSMPWRNADLLSVQRMAVANAFADSIRDVDHVEGVWVRRALDCFEVCVVVSDDDLELDLDLRERFIELASQRLNPGEGDVFVYQKDAVPSWISSGIRVPA